VRKYAWVMLIVFVASIASLSISQPVGATEANKETKVFELVDKAVNYMDLKQYQKAIDLLKQAIELDPDKAYLHKMLGNLYLMSRQYQKAAEELEQAVRLAPDDSYAHSALGASYMWLQRNQEADEELKKAINLDPDNTHAHRVLGVLYISIARHLKTAQERFVQYQKAVEEFILAVKLNPNDAYAHFNLGAAYILLGDKSSALEEYKILKNLDEGFANKLFKLIYK